MPGSSDQYSKPSQGLFERFCRVLHRRVDVASLAFFRFVFGSLLFYEVVRFFKNGWILNYFVRPEFHFSYFGFEWIKPLPDVGMFYVFYVMAVLTVMVAVGLFYRVSSVLLFLCWAWVFLIERAIYLNHLYLVCLLCFLMMFVQANRGFSLDAYLFPKIKSSVIPAWNLWILRFQIGVVYFYGGLAKIDLDWLSAQSMGIWVNRRQDAFLISPFLQLDWSPYFFAWVGLLFDLFIPFILLYKRTRPFGFILVIIFNAINKIIFKIGIFPYLGIAGATLFFSPEWPRKIIHKFNKKPLPQTDATPPSLKPWMKPVTAMVSIYILFQLFFPLRHHFIPGNASWNEEGHDFAWRMMLRHKEGDVRFLMKDPKMGETWTVDKESGRDPGERVDLDRYPEKQKMTGKSGKTYYLIPANKNKKNYAKYLSKRQWIELHKRPEFVRQYATFLAQKYEERHKRPIEVRAEVLVSLNGREKQLLIDPTINLAAEKRRLGPYPWVYPLDPPKKLETIKTQD